MGKYTPKTKNYKKVKGGVNHPHFFTQFWQDVSLTADGLSNGHLRERQQDIMIDSYISQSRHADVERELERWTPDKDDPQCPELENIFDGPWNRTNRYLQLQQCP